MRKSPQYQKCKQGRIHGQQLRTGGQERKCVFSHFLTRAHRRTDRPTDGWTDRRTDKASYRVACPQLKRKRKKETKKERNNETKKERKNERMKKRKK